MRKLLFTALLASVSLAKAQSTNVPAILKRLYQESGSVTVYSFKPTEIVALSDLPKNFKYKGQEITKTKKGLFLNPTGTGRIYQLIRSSDSLVWKRIDSTIFTGYNFGSLFFSIDSTLFSFSGIGFFNYNGNLRYFNEVTKEWDAANLSHAIFWHANAGKYNGIDTSEKSIYIEAMPFSQDQTLKQQNKPDLINSLWKLNINTGDWSRLGKIKDPGTHTLAETPFGTLLSSYRIIDIKNNKVFKLNQKLYSRFISIYGNSSFQLEPAYSYCIDSTFFGGDSNNYIDSVVISKQDLIELETPFYLPIENEQSFGEREIMLGSIILLSLACVFLLLRNKKKGTTQPVAIIGGIQENTTPENDKKETQVTFRSGKLMELLNERERLLLDFIYNHSMDERLTTIEEINKVIGASQRSAEVQKRLRSDLIGAINDKLEIVSESKFNVIEKQRSEFDKRSFEYFIHPEQMELTEKVLGKKTN